MIENRPSIFHGPHRETGLTKLFFELGDVFMGMEIQGQENLRIARNHIESRGSLLITANHRNWDDPFRIGLIVNEYITSLGHVWVPTSRRHLDSAQGHGLEARIIEALEAELGFHVIPITQRKDRKLYPDYFRFDAPALIESKRVLRTEGEVLGISPEGERNDKLGRGEPVIEGLFKKSQDMALALPITFIPDRTFMGISRKRVVIGHPYSYAELEEEHRQRPEVSMSDHMMLHIAKPLAPKDRGFYAQYFEDETLAA